jgi:peroxiredoxin Q/BCP
MDRDATGRLLMTRGDLVPDFTPPDQDGTLRTLSKLLADGPVVLFFYPAAMMSGCHFRDLASEYAEVGAQRVGISADSVAKRQFAELNSFDYPLLSDPRTRSLICSAYAAGSGRWRSSDTPS